MSTSIDPALLEQRREERIERNVGIFVHVEQCAENPDWVGQSIPCEATNFSPHGMQCRSDLEFSPGDYVNVSIGIGSPFGMYLLRGEVRWCCRVNESIFDDLNEEALGDYAMGLQLHDSDHADLKRWIDNFDANFSTESQTGNEPRD